MGFLWGFMCHLVFFLEAYAAVVPGGRDAHLPETRPTDFLPVLKNRNEKAQQTMQEKRVYLRSRWVLKKKQRGGVGKEEERLSYSWYQGCAPGKPAMNDAGVKLSLSAGTQLAPGSTGLVPVLSWARASLPTAAPSHQTCSLARHEPSQRLSPACFDNSRKLSHQQHR